jgi:DNA-binding protein HU-beta
MAKIASTSKAKAAPTPAPAPRTTAKAAKSPAAAKPAQKAVAAPPKGKGPKVPVAPPAPVEAPISTVRQLSASYAEQHEVDNKAASALFAEVFATVINHIKDGKRVKIPGLGVIEVKDRPARMGRNPATGESIQIAASRKIAFRAAKELKEAI